MMEAPNALRVGQRRLVAVELTAALLVALTFASLCWVSSSYRGEAAMMPLAVSALGALASLVWALGCVRRFAQVRGETLLSRLELRRLATVIMLVICYVAVIPYLGFFTSVLIFVTVTPIALGLRPAWVALIAALGLALLLYLVFVVLLANQMPTDLIFG